MDNLAKIISTAFEKAFPHQTPSCVAGIGFFDGVHLGHQALAKEVVKLAKIHQAEPIILTFDPQPRTIIHPETEHLSLCTIEQKRQLFTTLGISKMIVIPFSLELAEKTPDDFLQLLINNSVKLKGICVGINWHFGKNAKGNFEDLQHLGQKLNIDIVGLPLQTFLKEKISSTRIRQAILAGDLLTAEHFLGRPYSVTGTIVHGRGIGNKELQCPTANITDPSLIFPPSGSYVTRAKLENNYWLEGIAYIGTCPTFKDNGHKNKVLELHLFNFTQNLYDCFVEIELLQFIRPEICFSDVNKLKTQINNDINFAKNYFIECNKIRN